jgi:hypothetical protein
MWGPGGSLIDRNFSSTTLMRNLFTPQFAVWLCAAARLLHNSLHKTLLSPISCIDNCVLSSLSSRFFSAWCCPHMWVIFIGVIIGWMILWVHDLKVFFRKQNQKNITFSYLFFTFVQIFKPKKIITHSSWNVYLNVFNHIVTFGKNYMNFCIWWVS